MDSASKDALRDAVRVALETSGVGIMEDPKRFVGTVSDVLGTDSADADQSIVRVLTRACDAGILAIFARAVREGTPDALRVARTLAGQELQRNLLMQEDASRDIAGAMALGMADYLQVALEDDAVVPRFDESPSIQVAASTQTPEAISASVDFPEPVSEPVLAPAPTVSSTPASQPVAPKRTRFPGTIAVVVLVCVLVLAGAGFALGWFGGGASDAVVQDEDAPASEDVPTAPDAALKGWTEVSEDELDLVVATYKYKGKPRFLTVRDVIEMTSTMDACRNDDGTYVMPSADDVTYALKDSVAVEEAEARGINPSEDELLDYLESNYGLERSFEKAAADNQLDVEIAHKLVRNSYLIRELGTQLSGVQPPEEEPKAPEFADADNPTDAELEAYERYMEEYSQYSLEMEAYYSKVEACMNEIYVDVTDIQKANEL